MDKIEAIKSKNLKLKKLEKKNSEVFWTALILLGLYLLNFFLFNVIWPGYVAVGNINKIIISTLCLINAIRSIVIYIKIRNVIKKGK